MLNTLFLEGVPDERQIASSLLSESLEQAKINAASIFSLKKIHP